jgi:hypothetical protein
MKGPFIAKNHYGTRFNTVLIGNVEIFGTVCITQSKVAGNLDVSLKETCKAPPFPMHADPFIAFAGNSKPSGVVGPEHSTMVSVMADADDSVKLDTLAHYSGVFRAMAEHSLKRLTRANYAPFSFSGYTIPYFAAAKHANLGTVAPNADPFVAYSNDTCLLLAMAQNGV